ncbi:MULTISPECIES: PadR family transcriptional regulator [unclassified Nocardiopsis]|uniref:PadR family transcriptional regulator n=1 Tax=Nocardiopsis TaxID=2013 RepID=UPI00387B676A
MPLTPAELTVLGLVVERPRHGYDLEQVIARRGVRRWADIGFSSIYYLLGRLEKRGLVHVPEAPAAATSRRVFHATDAGRRAAREGALALLREAAPVAHPLLVGVANLDLLTPAEYAGALGERLAVVEEQIAAVRAAEAAQGPLPRAAREVFSYSLSLMEAERAWLAERARVRDDR